MNTTTGISQCPECGQRGHPHDLFGVCIDRVACSRAEFEAAAPNDAGPGANGATANSFGAGDPRDAQASTEVADLAAKPAMRDPLRSQCSRRIDGRYRPLCKPCGQAQKAAA